MMCFDADCFAQDERLLIDVDPRGLASPPLEETPDLLTASAKGRISLWLKPILVSQATYVLDRI